MVVSQGDVRIVKWLVLRVQSEFRRNYHDRCVMRIIYTVPEVVWDTLEQLYGSIGKTGQKGNFFVLIPIFDPPTW